MGIYYNSNETRMYNIIRQAGLTMDDMTVIDPRLCFALRNFGRKCYQAILDQLAIEGRDPGTWNDNDVSIYEHKKLAYYKEHRDEIQKDYPVQKKRNLNAPAEPEKPKDDWETYRKQLATDIMMKLVGIGHFEERVDVYGHPITAFDAAYTPSAAADYAVRAADALVARLKEIH